MLFNTAPFALFLPLVLGAYWLLRRNYRAQNMLLLAASLVFYGWWDIRFLYLFILTTGVDFYCALMIGRGRVEPRQRLIVSAVLVGSALLCLVIPWKAIAFGHHGAHVYAHVNQALARTMVRQGSLVLLATAAVVGAVNALNPWLAALDEPRRRKLFMTASAVSNLGVLGFFKYYDFFASSFASAVHSALGVHVSSFTLDILLPAGISFYTFQSLAYTIEVYRRQVEPEPKYLTLTSYLSFFPLLVAGPIERPTHLLPQFLRPRTMEAGQVRNGIWLIVWGLFKKMVVADNMATIVGDIFGPYDHILSGHVAIPHDGLRLLLGVYAFAMQIYGDFSGYTDIARGVSKLFGFDVMLNFNLPYFALSPSDFWRRWHISLSTWLRDYLYIPLGGNRGGIFFTYRNLFLTMLLGGLWHGANWTFILWGAYHGAILIVYRLFDLQPEKKGRYPRWVNALMWVLMLHLTMLGWLLFRAKNVTTISVFLQSILLHPHWSPEATAALKDIAYFGWFLILFQIIQYRMKTLDPMSRWHWFVRLNVWIFVVMSLLAMASTEGKEFIYFAF